MFRIKRLRRLSGELKNQKMTISMNDVCHIHFSNGKNIDVTLRQGKLVSELLNEVLLMNNMDMEV